MSTTTTFKKKTTVRFSLPPSFLTAPLRLAPFLKEPILGRLFFTPIRRRAVNRERLPPPVARLSVRGRRVLVRARGRGPAILLVHGWQGSAGDLERLGDELVRSGYSVVTCDMPAHGETEGVSTSVAEFAEVIEKVSASVGPLHSIVGHSLGATATALSLGRGVKVQGAVLLAPMISFDFALDEFSRALGLDENEREITARAAERRVGFSRREGDLNNLQLPELPVLLIHDRLDRRTPVEHSEAFARSRERVSFVATEGFGHNRILGETVVVARILSFVEALPRRPTEVLDLGLVPELVDLSR